MKKLILDGIERGIFPGAVVCIYREGEPLLLEAYGHRMVTPNHLPMQVDTLFDLASLTKPIATATSMMILREQGRVQLEDDLSAHLPGFSRKGISLFNLLIHTSGIPAWRPLYIEVPDKSKIVQYLSEMPLEYETGSKVVYSCLGYILLGEMIRAVTGTGVDEFSRDKIFLPLGMNDTFYNPPQERRLECAATEDSNSFERRKSNYRNYEWRKGVVVGNVHDENANSMGGVAGNAGLFSTASDLAKYCQMLINGGDGILSPESVRMIATCHTDGLNDRRSIGWAVRPEGTLVHTGFTGTAAWINIEKRFAALLLTNRVHPDATKEGIGDFRQEFYAKVKEGMDG